MTGPLTQRRMPKRGQMEVIGLVVIVLLISLGMIFMAIFALKTGDDKKIFTRKELATSTLAAVLRTTIVDESCYDVSDRNRVPLPMGEKILEDCIIHSNPLTLSNYNCEGADGVPTHSCEFFEQTAARLLDLSLGEATSESLHKRYELNVQIFSADNRPQDSPVERIVSARGGCPKSSGQERDSSKPFPLQVEGVGVVQVELYICD